MPGIQKATLIALACCVATHAHGQGASTPPDVTKTLVKVAPAGPKPIKNEISFGYRLHTDGWSMYVDHGSVRSPTPKLADMFYSVRVLQLEFSEKKHPKQQKVAGNDASGNSTNFVYGKINNFYGLKVGYGFRKMLAGKPDPGCVSIHWTTVAGPALGLLKPYYLLSGKYPSGVKFSETTQRDFLNINNIEGAAGFGMGLSEVKTIPGAHLKTLLHFDFAANRKTVTAIETGAAFEYYSDKVEMMFNQPGTNYFMNFFVAFQFGKRW